MYLKRCLFNHNQHTEFVAVFYIFVILIRIFRMRLFALFPVVWGGALVFCQDYCRVQDGKDGLQGIPGRDGMQGPKGEKGQPGRKVICEMHHPVKTIKEIKLLYLINELWVHHSMKGLI